jgi:hypothetical protein
MTDKTLMDGAAHDDSLSPGAMRWTPEEPQEHSSADTLTEVFGEPLGLSPAHQLVDQLVVHGLGRLRLSRLHGSELGHAVAGHRCIFHDRELHRTIYSPASRRRG